MVEVSKFYYVKCSRYVEYGIKKGDLVYIAGEMMSAVDEKDPYLYRKLFLAAFMEGGHVKADVKPITIDGANLRNVSESQQKKLYAQLEKDFSREEES